jgi:hypothetical protein
MIKAITLTHPWAFCIAEVGKDVENRTWRPERQGGKVGMYLAIHGGAVPGKDTGKREEARMDLAGALRIMAAQGTYESTSQHRSRLEMGLHASGEEQFFLPGIVAVARVTGVTTNNASPWAVRGQYHWALSDVTTLPTPIPYRGAQGLWDIDADTIDRLRAHWAAAHDGEVVF